jgi:hypothetical protein
MGFNSAFKGLNVRDGNREIDSIVSADRTVFCNGKGEVLL